MVADLINSEAFQVWLDSVPEETEEECSGVHASIQDIFDCEDCSKALDAMDTPECD